jgi:hypothetical protein
VHARKVQDKHFLAQVWRGHDEMKKEEAHLQLKGLQVLALMVAIDALATKKSAIQAVGVYALTIVLFAFLCLMTTLFMPSKGSEAAKRPAVPESAVVQEKPAAPETVCHDINQEDLVFWS